MSGLLNMAEGQGFEPWDSRPSLVFKTSAFGHSATPPKWDAYYLNRIKSQHCSFEFSFFISMIWTVSKSVYRNTH